ncbi:MAG: hypothetical protein PW845_09770 [Pseudomonas sp.]|uniref:hypothetical protein n=1 Tax=Pseudomonas abieticivorans TaxID=2931382 RepID=UPI0020C17DF7|nr:hypothetical protein [Pseudomonas sp. PIA16]MDE1165659.1 hypothetical protein [Pseudomonas sp.]
MNKLMHHLPHWNRSPDAQVQHQLAVPLLVLGGLLVASGVIGASFTMVAVGIIGVAAALGLERQ